MANWIVLRKRDGKVFARNCILDEEDEITKRGAQYLLRLNGRRNPMKLKGFSRAECEEYFEQMDDLLLLREPGRKQKFGLARYYTMYIPKKKRTKSALPYILNTLLLSLCLPLLFLGLLTCRGVYIDSDFSLTGCLIGLLCGMVAHELGHAVACLGYGGWWLEAGLMRSGILPGAYVMLDDSGIRSRLKKVQIALAGVEANLLLAGALLILLSHLDYQGPGVAWRGVMWYAALQNMFLAFLNLAFVQGFDGEQAISLLLGKESAVEAAKVNIRCMFDREKRIRYLDREGVNGLANVLVSCIILLFQLFVPLISLIDIAAVMGVIF